MYSAQVASRRVLSVLQGATSKGGTRPSASVAVSRNGSVLKQNSIHPLFSRKSLREDVWVIEEKYFVSWNRANIFFIKGSTADLLVDTGVGIYDLPRYLIWSGLRKAVDEKPLYVALTHSHFDHTGGAHQFENIARRIFIHPAEERFLQNGSPLMTVSWITPQEVTPKPIGTGVWRAEDYQVKKVKNLTTYHELDTIDLGDKEFKVLHLPGHSPGSVGLHDPRQGILVTGDTLYQTNAELIDWYPGSSVKKMWSDVERLHGLAEKKQVDLLLPGHNDPLDREGTLRAADRHLSGTDSTKRARKKLWPRTKSTLVFALHGFIPKLPESARDWTFN